MRNANLKRTAVSLGAAALLLWCMAHAPSSRIALAPFLVCSIASAGEGASRLLGKDGLAAAFRKAFVVGFLAFWVGFLALASLYALNGNYALLVPIVPFWLVGALFFRRALPASGRGDLACEGAPGMLKAAAVALVAVAAISGLALLFTGLARGELALAAVGAIFAAVSLAFVLFGLSAQGAFDFTQIDVVGLYMGATVAIAATGILAMQAAAEGSLPGALEKMGPWAAVPAIMLAGGIAQLAKGVFGGRRAGLGKRRGTPAREKEERHG